MKLSDLQSKIVISTKIVVYDAGYNKIYEEGTLSSNYSVNNVSVDNQGRLKIVLNEDIVNPDEFVAEKKE